MTARGPKRRLSLLRAHSVDLSCLTASVLRFYFNATTGESSWADPRQSVEFDLRWAPFVTLLLIRLRHRILSECIATFRASRGPAIAYFDVPDVHVCDSMVDEGK